MQHLEELRRWRVREFAVGDDYSILLFSISQIQAKNQVNFPSIDLTPASSSTSQSSSIEEQVAKFATTPGEHSDQMKALAVANAIAANSKCTALVYWTSHVLVFARQ